jgi:hypothetical protein
MAARKGIFDPALEPDGIFDPTLDNAGIFDETFGETAAAGGAFDPAFMQAMNRPWRDIVFSQPQVVASGMTPPDNVPN